MTEDVETVPLKGRRVTWDGANGEELRALAGEALIGTCGNSAVVRSWGSIEPVIIRPGWSFTLWNDGSWTIASPRVTQIRVVEQGRG